MIEWIIVGLSAIITQRAIDKRTPKEELSDNPQVVKEIKETSVQESYAFEVDSEITQSDDNDVDDNEENTDNQGDIREDGNTGQSDVSASNDDDQSDISETLDEEIQSDETIEDEEESLMDV